MRTFTAILYADFHAINEKQAQELMFEEIKKAYKDIKKVIKENRDTIPKPPMCGTQVLGDDNNYYLELQDKD